GALGLKESWAMNAITFLVVAAVVGSDTGWSHTNRGAPRYQTQYDGNFARVADQSTLSGPTAPAFLQPNNFANQPMDDLPERPRIDNIPFSNRQGWNTRTNTNNQFQPGLSNNTLNNNGFNNNGFNNNNGLSNNGLNNGGLNNNGLNNNGFNNNG